MYKWYAIQSSVSSKDAFMAELKKGGYNPKSGDLKEVLIFEFKKDNLDIDEKEDSLLEGYVLIRVNDKKLVEIVKLIKSRRVGEFFNVNQKGLPPSIPDSQVKAFRKKVLLKKSRISVGQAVRVTEGILGGFSGKVLRKKALMAQIAVQLPNRVVKRWVAIPHLSTSSRDNP
ncbi:Transcription termination factor nusG [uncultured archaeon]|nr:Transcription termination factor nusG [uncultured archaeon]